MAFLKTISKLFSQQSDNSISDEKLANLVNDNKALQSKVAVLEEELARCKSDLEYTNKLYGAAFYSSAQLASISKLSTGKFIDVNDAWVQTRGFSREEAIGKTANELNIWGGDNLNRKKILDDITAHGRLRNYEIKSVMRSGEVRDFILNAEVLEAGGQELLFFSGVDITEHKNIERNLQRSQKLDAVGQLTGGIAHDFNNLLGIILGNLELIAESLPEDERLQSLLNSAIHGAERGAIITKKLLSFSSTHASGSEITNINELVSSMKDLLAKSVTVAITVETRLADDAWLVKIDASDFEDAIINLSMNAYDAMPDGGTLSIETYNTELDANFVKLNPDITAGDYLAINISDTGEGFPEEIKDRIFEPFFTTKDHGKGTGLGLSMVFGFVKRAKGHIQVNSEKGIGTKFTLFLPRCKETLENTDAKEKTRSPLLTGTETILIVDDEHNLVDIAKTKLENLGYATYCATTGEQAITLLNKRPEIDMLFSDIVMPGVMNGFQLAVAAKERRPDLKILLTSGYSRADELLSADAEDKISDISKRALPKPYTYEQLAKAIRTTLDRD